MERVSAKQVESESPRDPSPAEKIPEPAPAVGTKEEEISDEKGNELPPRDETIPEGDPGREGKLPSGEEIPNREELPQVLAHLDYGEMRGWILFDPSHLKLSQDAGAIFKIA